MTALTRVLTVEECRALDEAAVASGIPMARLIDRAGAAVAFAARRFLGGVYGRRVVVLAGTGNNGADGRAAALVLRQWGAQVEVIEITRHRPFFGQVPRCDLVVDAVLGTGFHGTFRAPEVAETPVLAVDLPSGVDASTGWVSPESQVLRAEVTVTFGGWKPGLLFGEGARLAGAVEVADIGLSMPASFAAQPGTFVLSQEQVRARMISILRPTPTRHKWAAAVGIVGGSPLMTGAPALVASGAFRSGAGMVRVGTPGEPGNAAVPVETVRFALPTNHWASPAMEATSRCHAVVVGPGLGRSKPTLASARSFSLRASCPLVIDADALSAFGDDVDDDRASEKSVPAAPSAGTRAVQDAIARRQGLSAVRTPTISTPTNSGPALLSTRRLGSTILTPHDGEFEILSGRRPGPDRIAAARSLAADSGAVVVLKGPNSVVADPTGRTEIVTSGDVRLSTAGTGDVLAGIIASFVAQGLLAFDAAACGTYVHGAASARGFRRGLRASDLGELVAGLLSDWASND